MRNLTFLIFVFLTFCCWGLYGPVLHVGQELMGADGSKSSLRPFICVGIAYFLIAVLFPLGVLLTKGEKGNWSGGGFFWSFFAGAVGAIGALGIILAFKFEGKPVYVMPLVFGLAPVVNTFVTMFMARTFKNASLLFYIGILIVAIGAAGVLSFKPAKPKTAKAKETTEQTEKAEEDGDGAGQGTSDTSTEEESGEVKTTDPKSKGGGNPFLVACFVGLTALCWGAYGPVLHKGQARMGGSRLRPFLCVGLAYFAIAVLVPIPMLSTFQEPGGWPADGITWSMLAGIAGGLGALGIIYAFNWGGKPIFVMPLVFGFAPVINTFTETIKNNLLDELTIEFFISLGLVIFGAILVLICAPRGKKPTPAVEKKSE